MIYNSDILFSIQPRYIKMILDGRKTLEYRNKYWKVSYPNWFYVYESKPISKLKYVLFLDHPYKMGEVIPYTSYGTDSFNNCSMHRNYAYPIKEIFEINPPIDLATLRTIGITPPQNYLYVSKNQQLVDLLTNRYFSYFEQLNLFNNF